MTCQSGGKTGRGYLWMSSLRGGSHTHRISVSQRSLGPSPSTWLANPVVSQDLSAPGPLLAIRMKTTSGLPRANDSELFIPLFCTREIPLFDSIERKKINRLTPTWNSILPLLVMAPYVGLVTWVTTMCHYRLLTSRSTSFLGPSTLHKLYVFLYKVQNTCSRRESQAPKMSIEQRRLVDI